MEVYELLALLGALLGAASLFVAIVILNRVSSGGKDTERLMALRDELLISQREATRASAESTGQLINAVFDRQDKRLEALTQGVSESLAGIGRRFAEYSQQSEQKLDNLRKTMETSIGSMREDNNKQLEKMRETVDEKLQKTLEERLGKSFKLVNDSLEQVFKGLGEMQTLAADVGGLKNVLANVKNRGTMGEIQLGAILEDILPPEQFERQVAIRPDSSERVDFAIRLPGDDDGNVYLPIDAKFPLNVYQDLLDAYDASDPIRVEASAKVLDGRVRACAKDIRDKYINPPDTTDFAILFLPNEGLYAEVVRRGLMETLQRSYKVTVAGPANMAALLNSLQMGFRTLAIQKRSGEVWQVLGAVKTEFEAFGQVLEQAQTRLKRVDEDLDKLIGVRTRQIQRRLRNVETLPSSEKAAQLLLEDH